MTDSTNLKKEVWQFIKSNLGSCLSWAITFAWLIYIFLKIKRGELPSSLNEFGDFIAGAFAPLAFFWLVRGYYQQGAELQAQALELKNSVQQQTRLAEIYEVELRQKHFQVMPRLIFKCKDYNEYVDTVPLEDDDGNILDIQEIEVVDYYLDIVNEGETARNLILRSKRGHPYIRLDKYDFKKNDSERIKFHMDGQAYEMLLQGRSFYIELEVIYHDIYGKQFNKDITCTISGVTCENSDHVYLECGVVVKDKTPNTL